MVVLATEGRQDASCQDVDNGIGVSKARLVFSHDEAQIYFLDPKEQVPTGRDITTVRLVLTSVKHQDPLSVLIPPAFLQAGNWFYPLIPSKTPVYRTKENYYIFPDLLSTSPGAAVGIIFPENLTTYERDMFEIMLLHLAGLDKFPTGYADKCEILKDLINTDDAIAANLNESNRMEGESPAECKTEEVDSDYMTDTEMVSDGVTKSLDGMELAKSLINSNFETAKECTEKAIEISSHAVRILLEATSNLAVFSAHYITSAAYSVLGTIHDQTLQGTLAINDGAMHTLGIVYEALHNAGRTLAHSITHNHVLDHRYGAGKSGHILELGPEALAAINPNSETAEKVKID